MLKKAAEKLFTSESHRVFLVVILVIPPTEADLGFVDGKKPVIGDGHAMRITSQVLQDMFWTSKRRLRIDHPVLGGQVVQECGERLRIGKWQTLPMECELLMLNGIFQTFQKLVAKDRTEHLDRQEEIRWR